LAESTNVSVSTISIFLTLTDIMEIDQD